MLILEVILIVVLSSLAVFNYKDAAQHFIGLYICMFSCGPP